ncbi:hypothetical protein EON62_01200 [archaeon]|nr:MAG: hypothetical protein EON62_01200 [archaeon]
MRTLCRDFEDDASTSVLSLPLASSSRAAVHSNRGTSAAVQGEADASHEDSIPLDEDIEEDVLDTTTGGSFSARGVEAAAAAGAPRVFQVSLNSATSPQRTAAAAVAATAAPADADEDEDDDLYGGFY